ncbi:lipase family protein [Paenibacillus chondroitinus]|uniref:Lipase family protein n=1 Tax=Paenibacillus chondroitinus TaxID=59842 RepID=A0ABU6DEZ4_9BACL|nr:MULTISPECIES: lipase family protein [Paenibacillus]MCY9661520.1 lipase family protein [Paenibacillus anseongense]MEB4796288.1 lipase family protein [Paenibacillus chondroitinus]
MLINTLDTRTAIFLAAMCSQSYGLFANGPESVILPRNYRMVAPFTATSVFSNKELFGFIAESDTQIVIVFRGTSSTSDWISDAIARQTAYPYAKDGGLVHKGFLDIYNSARKQIIAVMSKLSPRKTLYLTGHSLGGCLANLCALDLTANTRFKEPSVYTYGSPRVGNPAFSSLFNRRTGPRYRIYNTNDVVPELPPFIYRSPRTDQVYHYLHVKKGVELTYQAGSMSANHAISGYFAELAKLDPRYAEQLQSRTPGFCP